MITDHSAILHLSFNRFSDLTGKLCRWILALQKYDITFEGMSEEEKDGIKKGGSRNDSDFQEKYVDNLERRGELESNGKNEEDNLREIEESPLLVDESEGSGLNGEKIKHNSNIIHLLSIVSECQQKNRLVTPTAIVAHTHI